MFQISYMLTPPTIEAKEEGQPLLREWAEILV